MKNDYSYMLDDKTKDDVRFIRIYASYGMAKPSFNQTIEVVVPEPDQPKKMRIVTTIKSKVKKAWRAFHFIVLQWIIEWLDKEIKKEEK